jgi:hypothetical protein
MDNTFNNINLNNIITTNKLTNISIFIYSKNNNKITFLLGKENNTPYNKTDVDLFCEFHGIFINDESIEQATSRIIFEKTMNMLDDTDKLEKIIPSLPYVIDKENSRIIFAYEINYLDNILVPKFYNKIFAYLNLCTSSNTQGHTFIDSCPIGFLDKSELGWFSTNDIWLNQTKFSINFYRNLDKITDKIFKSN